MLLSHSVHKVQPRVVTGENFLKYGKKFYCVFGYTSLVVHLAIQVQPCVFSWISKYSFSACFERGHVSKSSRFQLGWWAYLFVEVTSAPFYKFSSIKLHGFILSCYLRFQSPKSI